ncbi:hypothetical protein LHGZ1_2103 [Laribacter hongkongensis]|uniref:Uncharacterized protein n=1 Tax=Laribacter hongkongensis TaxID=168471 RepID=A0A248LKF1_9NEIS|nr:hypothetical protein LHGZ1_2103 [Laribacter hongkongensis]
MKATLGVAFVLSDGTPATAMPSGMPCRIPGQLPARQKQTNPLIHMIFRLNHSGIDYHAV